jgi:hypothetical protein
MCVTVANGITNGRLELGNGLPEWGLQAGVGRMKVGTGVDIYTFRIQGELCHRISTLLPPDGDPPKFAHIYIYDTDPQTHAQTRANRVHDKVDVNTVLQLQRMIECHNPYVAIYQMAKEWLDSQEYISLCLKTVDAPHLDQRCYNHPTASEVAVIMVGNSEDGATERDLILQARDGSIRSISYLKSFYISLRYPIMFAFGEQSWDPNIHLSHGYYLAFTRIFTNYICIFMMVRSTIFTDVWSPRSRFSFL